MEAVPPRNYWPATDWRTTNPEDVEINPQHLAQMHEHINTHLPGLQSLLIVRHGYPAFEGYYQGFHEKSYQSLSSATKSVVSALIGVALSEGLITSLDQPMLDFFPEEASLETDQRKHAVTIRHLLSLQTGFDKPVPHEYWLDPVHKALQRPMEESPGQSFHYDNQGVDILSGIMTRVSGMSAAAFAHSTLFKQLGIWQMEADQSTHPRLYTASREISFTMRSGFNPPQPRAVGAAFCKASLDI